MTKASDIENNVRVDEVKKLKITDDPDYYPKKMREYRKRRSNADKLFYKKWIYTIEMNGKKYCFLNPKDVKIEKVSKNVLYNDDSQSNYVVMF